MHLMVPTVHPKFSSARRTPSAANGLPWLEIGPIGVPAARMGATSWPPMAGRILGFAAKGVPANPQQLRVVGAGNSTFVP